MRKIIVILALVLSIVFVVFAFFPSIIYKDDLAEVNKAYGYYSEYYTNEFSENSLKEIIPVLSDVVHNNSIKKVYFRSEFKENTKINNSTHVNYYNKNVKNDSTFYSNEVIFLYLRALLCNKEYDLYRTEFAKYYPKVSKDMLLKNSFVQYLCENGMVDEEGKTVALEGFTNLRNQCEDDYIDAYVCALGENYLCHSLKKDSSEDAIEAIRYYTNNYHIILLPLTWNGFSDSSQSQLHKRLNSLWFNNPLILMLLGAALFFIIIICLLIRKFITPKQKSWETDIDGVIYDIKYTRTWYGKLCLEVNGEEQKLGTCLLLGEDKPIKIGNKECMISIQKGKPDIAVDGFYIGSKKPYLPPPKTPVLIWFTLVLISMIRILFNGPVPSLLMSTGIIACCLVVLNRRLTSSKKLLVCICITIAAWLFLLISLRMFWGDQWTDILFSRFNQ